jgi:thiamine pyrophosphokinase
MIDYRNTKSVLCLNGDLPELEFFKDKNNIVATDGAIDKLINIGVVPRAIIGDFDSVAHLYYRDIPMIYTPNQDLSDFEKALIYLEDNDLLPTIVCGVTGGVIDHILYNINVIMKNHCLFYDRGVFGVPLRAPIKRIFNLKLDSKISFIAMCKAKIRTLGLKWELNNDYLEFPGRNSPFNRTAKEEVIIEVLEGEILILIHS